MENRRVAVRAPTAGQERVAGIGLLYQVIAKCVNGPGFTAGRRHRLHPQIRSRASAPSSHFAFFSRRCSDDAQALMHDRAGGGVLQMHLLTRIQVFLDGKSS